MKSAVIRFALTSFLLCLSACMDEPRNVAAIGVDFDWQPIDKGAQDNPEIRLTGVPDGTRRFLVSLVDLNLNGFDHGSGFVDYDGSDIIARGAVKGSYNGPDPPFASVKHSYEITVTAYDENGDVIGVGKKDRVFVYSEDH